MAQSTRIVVSGMDEAIAGLQKLEAAGRAEAMREMVLAGVSKAEDIWRDTIRERGHVSDRKGAAHMVDAVGHTDPEANAYGVSCEVYPLGEDDRGVRQRAKAAYIENGKRGTGSRKKAGRKNYPDKFISGPNGINKTAEPLIQQAVMDKYKEITGE